MTFESEAEGMIGGEMERWAQVNISGVSADDGVGEEVGFGVGEESCPYLMDT